MTEHRYVVSRLYTADGIATDRVILNKSTFKPGAKEARHYGRLIEEKGIAGGVVWRYLTQIVLDTDIPKLPRDYGETDVALLRRTGLDFVGMVA